MSATSESEEAIRKLLPQLDTSIESWQGRLADLGNDFRHEDVDRLLADVLDSASFSRSDRVRRIIDLVVCSGYKDKYDGEASSSSRRTTPVHHAAYRICCSRAKAKDALRELFKVYDRRDVNYTDDCGYTHFHAACEHGLLDVAKRFLDSGQDPDVLVSETRESPLHLAVERRDQPAAMVELLLKHGANPNLANCVGFTALHKICDIRGGACDFAEILFKVNDELNQLVRVDALNEFGQTPLHRALHYCDENLIGCLLKNGADQNSADAEGSTPLHYISRRDYDNELAEIFFKFNDELRQEVQVDVWDKKGRTPLQLALLQGSKKTCETLMRRGADLNLANSEGSTPLHIICQRYSDDELAKTFFEIADDLQRTLRVDARDKLGRTPLDLAVATLLPNTVDLLLDRGADLSGFVFPTVKYFGEKFEVGSFRGWWPGHELRLASGLMVVVERLEKRGYELDRSDALAIMKLFDKSGLFDLKTHVEKGCYDVEAMATMAKRTMVNSSLSLYDLIQLRPEEAKKLLTYEDYLQFSDAINWWEFPASYWKACSTHLNEKIYSGFVWHWALDPFMELTNYRLPHLPCEMIMRNLKNEDLYNICVAALGQFRDVYKCIYRIHVQR